MFYSVGSKHTARVYYDNKSMVVVPKTIEKLNIGATDLLAPCTRDGGAVDIRSSLKSEIPTEPPTIASAVKTIMVRSKQRRRFEIKTEHGHLICNVLVGSHKTEAETKQATEDPMFEVEANPRQRTT